MDGMKSMCADMWGWLSSPFKRDMPPLQLALVIVVFIVIAYIVYDGVRILKSWMEAAAEAASEAA